MPRDGAAAAVPEEGSRPRTPEEIAHVEAVCAEIYRVCAEAGARHKAEVRVWLKAERDWLKAPPWPTDMQRITAAEILERGGCPLVEPAPPRNGLPAMPLDNW